jgi:hypothetical protein
MAFGKLQYGTGPRFDVRSRFALPDWAGLVAIVAAPAVVLLLLIPLPLVPPVVSLLSFMIAGGVALYALFTKASREAQGITLWDVAAGFTLSWIVAGTMSNPKHVLGWFDSLSLVP